MKEISLEELMAEFLPSQIVDVREKEEFHDFNLGGRNIPAHLLQEFLAELNGEEKLAVICSNGLRSSIVARLLEKKLPTTPIFHLTNGLMDAQI